MSTMTQAQDALFTRKWLSEEEQEEDKFTSSSFAAALKAIAERNRVEQPENAKPALAAKPTRNTSLKITEIQEEATDEVDFEAETPGAKKKGGKSRIWSWLTRGRALRPEKQMRVSEIVSLGEKRFVAILNIEGRKFLIGGGSNTVQLLTNLDGPASAPAIGKRGE